MTDERRTILVVDDDEDFREQVRVQFEAAGYDVVTAGTEAEAEKVLESRRVDAAVVDLMMEHMDTGFMVAYKIKKRDKSVPVVMVTAVTSETGLRFEGAVGGEHSWIKADAIMAKPVRFEQLLGEVERLLGA